MDPEFLKLSVYGPLGIFCLAEAFAVLALWRTLVQERRDHAAAVDVLWKMNMQERKEHAGEQLAFRDRYIAKAENFGEHNAELARGATSAFQVLVNRSKKTQQP